MPGPWDYLTEDRGTIDAPMWRGRAVHTAFKRVTRRLRDIRARCRRPDTDARPAEMPSLA